MQERPGSETLARAKAWWDASAAKPRFLWVHLYEPHAPYEHGGYLGEVAAADAMLADTLGPLLAASPDAMVIVTGDHGEALGDHGEETHGLFAYESTLAVPLRRRSTPSRAACASTTAGCATSTSPRPSSSGPASSSRRR